MNKININYKKKIIVYLLLLIYGCVTSYSLIKTTRLAQPIGPLEDYFMSLRVTWLDYFINEVKNTGIYTGLHRLYDHNAVMYLYLSHFSAILGIGDALHTFFSAQLIIVCSCIALYPVIFYRLSDSVLLSLASVLFFKIYAPYSIYLNNDSYFIYGWMTFISLPVLFFLFRDKWTNKNYIWVMLLLGVMASSNIFRSSAGLAIAASLCILMLIKIIIPSFKIKNYKRITVGLLICIAAVLGQNFFTSTVPHVYQSLTNQPDPLPTKGPWHTLYIGLGWEENPIGIEYADRYGYIGREHLLYQITADGYMGIESPDYIKEMKSVYMDAVVSDVNFFVGSYFRKMLAAIKTIWENTVANVSILSNGWYYTSTLAKKISFVMPFVLLGFFIQQLKSNRRKVVEWLLIAGFIAMVNMAFGILPGIIANPFVREYTFGMTATLDCMVMAGYMVVVYEVINLLLFIMKKIFGKN